jgi:glycosyltransferase involved in cell wall biosynthesis
MKSLLYVGNKLSEHGHTATAIEVLGPFLEQEGFKVVYTSSKKGKLARLADMLRQTFSRRTTTNYVLIDTYSTWNFWYAFAVSQLCRILAIKYIPILHGGNLPVRLENNRKICGMIFGNSIVNVAPSGYLADAFSRAGFRVTKIPNPFDAADFHYLKRTTLEPKLLWVRSFSSIYNPEMALRTLKIVSQKYPDAKLCMIGPDKNGILENIRQRAASDSLNVIFTGRKTKKEWAALSKEYDIFLNTAKIDNTPFSIIEALSLGMAVVSTNVGGIPHLLQDRETALLVNDNDAEAMADAIAELIENKKLSEKILTQSRDLAAQSDWQNVRQKWLEILN